MIWCVMNYRWQKTIIIAVLSVFFIAACRTVLPAPDSSKALSRTEGIAYLTDFIERGMQSGKVTGAAVALVDEDSVIWSRGFGYADRENDIIVTDRTVFGAGSISKMFTACAVMQLVEQGLIDLDTPVRTYLPEFTVQSRFPEQREITPRLLLSHMSGLESDITFGMWNSECEGLTDFHDILPYLCTRHMAYKPGYIFSYCNPGFDLLGLIIERVSGQDFCTYIRQQIFLPLGMDTASFEPIALRTDLPAGLASRGYYAGSDRSWPGYTIRDIPAGSLNLSVRDLARFMRMILNGGSLDGRHIVSRETLVQMQTVQNEDNPFGFGSKIGLGCFLNHDSLGYAGTYCGHGGDTILFHASLDLLPGQKLGAVVLINTRSSDAVAPALSAQILKTALHMEHGFTCTPPKKTPVREANIPVSELEALTGDYETAGGLVHISRTGNRLETEFGGRKLQFVSLECGWFRAQYKLLGIIPVSVPAMKDVYFSVQKAEDRLLLLVKHQGIITVYGSRIKPVALSQAWQGRTGDYEVVNCSVERKSITFPPAPALYIKDGYLRYSPDNGKYELVLLPVNDTEAVVAGLGRGRGQTIYVREFAGRECLDISGWMLGRK
ncbi:MAG: beta-lactamase family protein [Spirochaetales bacterium]|nr:beta-lactamase family protein [Spirochaetales bacterium]